mgnify:CR=1 FL=1
MVAGVAVVVCDAVKHWEDETKCLTELLGALQTLCWDKACIRSVLQADVVKHLADYVQVCGPTACVHSCVCVVCVFLFLLHKCSPLIPFFSF